MFPIVPLLGLLFGCLNSGGYRRLMYLVTPGSSEESPLVAIAVSSQIDSDGDYR